MMKSRKWHLTDRMKLPNQEKIKALGEKETYKYLRILEEDTIKDAEMKKKIERVFQENEKTTRNQAILQKPHQRDKHLDCYPCKILGTILKVDKGRTSTNGLENRKTNDDA